MWEKFIDPYERLYVGAYYSLMQILDGLGLAPHAVINMTTEGNSRSVDQLRQPY